MADTQVLGTCVFGRVGSSPTSRTNNRLYLAGKDSLPQRQERNLTYLFHDTHVISVAQRYPFPGASLNFFSEVQIGGG